MAGRDDGARVSLQESGFESVASVSRLTLPNPPDFLQREMAAMHMQLEDYQRAWEILRGIIGASS